MDKIVAMSPQRFVSGHRHQSTAQAPARLAYTIEGVGNESSDMMASDALDPTELSEPATNDGTEGLTFHVLGTAHETVLVTVIVPSKVCSLAPRERAMAEEVLQLNLTFSTAGSAQVVCTTTCSIAF
jgi:hypothetical protein